MRPITTGDSDLVKNLNLGIVLDLIREKGSLSRASVAKITGMSRSTCSIIVDQLIASGLVVESGKDASTGGRKPILVRINHDAGMVIGVKIMREKVVAAIVDLKGEAVITAEEEVGEPDGIAPYLKSLVKIIRRLVRSEKAREGKKLLGIGIGISGLVDFDSGISIDSSITHWKNVPLRAILKKEFALPVYLEKDVNTFAIGEKWLGIGRAMDNFICVTIGRGVGVGIIINGSVYRGSHHGAGEFGHVKVSDATDAPICSCGRKGCIEAFASNPAICDYVQKTLRRGEKSILKKGELTIEAILAAAKKGDPTARAAFQRAGRYLGYGVANLINLFDPEAIIISGEGTVAGEFILPEMENAIRENSIYGLHEKVKRIPLYFEDNMWVRGVATLVVREVFKIPL